MTHIRITGSNGAQLSVHGDFAVTDNGILVVKPEGKAPAFMAPGGGWVQVDIIDTTLELSDALAMVKGE